MARSLIHPGEHLAAELESLDMSAAEFARQICVPTNRVTQILNGQRAVTGDTALRLGHFFGTSAEFWLNLQKLYELRLAEQQRPADPTVLEERCGIVGFEEDVPPEPPSIELHPRFATDAADGREADHRYERVIEDPVLELHQLHAAAEALGDFALELANMPSWKHQPYVGDSAFAHKAGVHVSAILRNALTYEHVRPEDVGNRQRVLVSDYSGSASVLHKAAAFGIDLKSKDPKALAILAHLKELEGRGFQYEGAEASFELLMKRILGLEKRFFEFNGARVIVEKRKEREEAISEATVKLVVGGKTEHTVAEGKGPVNALDSALRKALHGFYPSLRQMELVDYKVRVLTAEAGTAAQVRVLIECGDRDGRWGTVGVSTNIIEAS